MEEEEVVEVELVPESGSPVTEDLTEKKSRRNAVPPRKSIPTTVPKPFNLGLNKRVEERQQYRHGVAQRQRDSDARAKVFKDEEVERERRELKEYRKSLVFKANPIMKYKDVTITPSKKELTCPSSPPLTMRSRKHNDGSEGGGSFDGTFSASPKESASQSPAPLNGEEDP